MGFAKEFKEFAVKGNAMDLAVGVIIGGAFAKIINSIVNDLIMPIVGAIFGQPDFSSMYIVLKGKGLVPDGTKLEEARKIADTAIFAYGNFITVLIEFLLLALVIFFMVRGINNLKRKEKVVQEQAPPVSSKEETLLSEIRDLLRNKK